MKAEYKAHIYWLIIFTVFC